MTRKQFDKFMDALVGAVAKGNDMSPALSIHGGQREDIFGMIASRIRAHLPVICHELMDLLPEPTGSDNELVMIHKDEDGNILSTKRWSKATMDELAQFVEDSKPQKQNGVTTAPKVDDNGW